MILHEGPQVLGLGFDFAIFWEIGKAILSGVDPYTVWGSFYPPAMSYAFAILALLPITVAYVLWIVASIGALVGAVGIKRAPVWLFFAPVLNVIAAGQVDLIFVALATQLPKPGWKSIVAAALITLKPQMALILLPWFLARWLLNDRRRLGLFVLAAGAIHAWPLLLDPGIGARWLQRMSGFSGAARGFSSPSIWALGGQNLGLWLVAAALIFAVGLILNLSTSRAANLLALPTAMYYDACALAGIAPAWMMIPLSWAALGWAHSAGNFAPLLLLPLAAFLWNVRNSIIFFSGRSQEGIVYAGRWAIRAYPYFTTIATPTFVAMLVGGRGAPRPQRDRNAQAATIPWEMMATITTVFIEADEATDRDSLELMAKMLRHIAARTRLDMKSDVAIEYAGEAGSRRTFGHDEGLSRGRTYEGEGAFFSHVHTLHLDDPNAHVADMTP